MATKIYSKDVGISVFITHQLVFENRYLIFGDGHLGLLDVLIALYPV